MDKENINPNYRPIWDEVEFFEGGPTRIPSPDPEVLPLNLSSHEDSLSVQEAISLAAMELVAARQQQLGRPVPRPNEELEPEQSDVQLLLWFLRELGSLTVDQLFQNSTSQ